MTCARVSLCITVRETGLAYCVRVSVQRTALIMNFNILSAAQRVGKMG